MTIQVISPTISASGAPMPGCGSRSTASRPITVSAKNTRSGTRGKRRIHEAAYPQIASTTTAVPPISSGLSHEPTRWTRKTAIGPGVKSRTAAPTAWTGLDSARSAVAAAWLSARPAAPAMTPARANQPRETCSGCASGGLEWLSWQLSGQASGRLVGPVHPRAHLSIVAHRVNFRPTRTRNPGMIDLVNQRIGIGTDVHRLAPGRSMRVAGLDWPDEEVGPEGHSDGDVVLHAICDALLSAAGLGDLGSNFGTSEPQWAGAASDDLLAETLRRVRGAGWEVGNVACQLIGNRPRFGPRREEAERGVAERHGIDVSLSATTTDGLGLTGRGEGLAAIATALLVRHTTA